MEKGQKEKPLANAKDFTKQVNYIISAPKRSKKSNLISMVVPRVVPEARLSLNAKNGNSINHLEAAGLDENWVALCRAILYPRDNTPENHLRAVRVAFKGNKKIKG